MRSRAFTLVESMIVLTTIVLLAALMMPVLTTARDSSKRVVCASNFHQVSIASALYYGDYDDRFMPVNHVASMGGRPTDDMTWVQLTLPYVKEFGIFECPSDYTRPRNQIAFEPSAVAGDPYARFYEASKRSNIGYNWLYLAPIIKRSGTWQSVPRFVSQAADPSNTILMTDSVYEVRNGTPSGGGFFLIYPPCRLTAARADSFRTGPDEIEFLTPEEGWEDLAKSDFGHIWTWHNQHANVLRIDGSLKALKIAQIEAGCSSRSKWGGVIFDSSSYMWDLR